MTGHCKFWHWKDISSCKNYKIPVVGNGTKDDGILGYTASATAEANTITIAGRGTIGFAVLRQYEYCPIIRLIVIEQSKYMNPDYLNIMFP